MVRGAPGAGGADGRPVDDELWSSGPVFMSSDRALARYLGRPVAEFLRIEAAGGVVLVAAAVLAMVWANSPWADSYQALWHTEVRLSFGSLDLSEDLSTGSTTR